MARAQQWQFKKELQRLQHHRHIDAKRVPFERAR
jgi:hypothetical protein